MEGHPARAGVAGGALGSGEHGTPDAAPPSAGLDNHATQRRDLVLDQHPAGSAERLLVERDDVDGLAVATVLVGDRGDALLVTEDAPAQLERLGDLAGIACLPDDHR